MPVKVANSLGADLIGLGAGWLRNAEQTIHQARHAEREDGVHVVPEFPFGQHFGWIALLTSTEAICEVIEEWIEVVVLDQEQAVVLWAGVVKGDAAGHLHPHGRLACPLLAEDDRGGGV